jgi:hypothetical protein
MGGIYKGKDQCHSLCVRSVTNLEEPAATDEWKVPSLVAESSVSMKAMASLNLNYLDFSSGIGSSG